MANREFKIQSDTISLNGVPLSSSADGKVVIPGVTRGSSFRVEEVEDRDGNEYQFTQTIAVIDYITYQEILNQTGDGSGRADYITSLDDELKIDEIEVGGSGTYTAEESALNSSNDMYAYTGTASASDRPIVPEDWIQIPFRPKMRANGVESDLGGGGADTGDVTFDANTIMGDGSLNLAAHPNDVENGKYLRVRGGDQDSHIHLDTPNNSQYDLYLGDDGKYVRVARTGEIVLGVDGAWEWDQNSGKRWKFDTAGGITFPDGSVQTTAYTTTDINPLGYFVTMQSMDNNDGDWDGEAVVVDGEGNTYVSYSYYSDDAGRMVGGIAKFDSTGAKLWAKNYLADGNYQYPRIASLEYFGLAPFIVAIGHHYNNNTNLNEGFMFMINPDGGFVGDYDVNFTAGAGMEVEDGVFYNENGPAAVVVGQTYNETATFTLTPVEPSGINKLYVTWSDLTASGLLQDQYANYTNNGTYGPTGSILKYQVVATVNGQGTQEWPYMYVTVTYNQSGTYSITAINGGSGYDQYSNQTLKILGSNLGGVDNTTLATANLAYASASGETSIYFLVNDYPNLLTETGGDGAWISGPGIPGGRAQVYNSQQAGGYFRFDIAPVVTLNSGDTYTFSRGNDLTFDFDFATFNNAGQPYQNPVGFSNIQGTAISNVYMPYYGDFDFSTVIGTPQTDMFSVNLDGQAAVIKLGGTSNWAVNVGGTDNEQLHAVAVDSANGDVYAVGYYYNNVNNKSGAIFKFDAAGDLVWSKYLDSDSNTGIELRTVDLTTYGEGQTAIYVTGDDRSVTKLDSDGNILWQVFTDDVSLNNDPSGCVTPEGDYIVLFAEDNNYHLFVTRLSGVDGSVVWQKDISYHQGYNWNGELNISDDFDATNIDCDATTISIAGSSYYYDGNNGVYRGYVINIPSDGAGNGTYGEYIISDLSIGWTTRSNAGEAFDPEFHTATVQNGSLILNGDNDNSSATVTSLGGTAPTVAGIERHSASAGNDTITLATEHNGKFLYYDGSNGNSTIYVPSNANSPLPIGYTVTLVIGNFNGNRLYVNSDNNSDVVFYVAGQNPNGSIWWTFGNDGFPGTYTIMKVDTDTWMLTGPTVQDDS